MSDALKDADARLRAIEASLRAEIPTRPVTIAEAKAAVAAELPGWSVSAIYADDDHTKVHIVAAPPPQRVFTLNIVSVPL